MRHADWVRGAIFVLVSFRFHFVCSRSRRILVHIPASPCFAASSRSRVVSPSLTSSQHSVVPTAPIAPAPGPTVALSVLLSRTTKVVPRLFIFLFVFPFSFLFPSRFHCSPRSLLFVLVYLLLCTAPSPPVPVNVRALSPVPSVRRRSWSRHLCWCWCACARRSRPVSPRSCPCLQVRALAFARLHLCLLPSSSPCVCVHVYVRARIALVFVVAPAFPVRPIARSYLPISYPYSYPCPYL